jgi:predicted ATPase/Tfp pilus assembly protein PilF
MAAEIELGTVLLGRYRVGRRLGAGGMGEVYLARDQRLDRPVALKVLHTRAADLGRLEREARTTSALNHPHILTVYDVAEQEGLRFISTEFIDGETLRARLARGPLGVEEAVRIATAVADALSAAHAAGIVHRDIKPENVMVRADGWVKLLDFGIAEAARPPDATVTAGGRDLVGTFGYFAPEQVKGESTSPATDVYALGVVLYEMLTGRRPFDDRAVGPYLIAVLNEDPPPPGEVHPEVPAPLSSLVSRMLARDLARRPPAMAAVMAELRALADAARAPATPMAVSRAPTAARHNLPQPLTGIVGRDEEIRAVAAMLESGETRLTTITGPGGAGKTRLAIEVGRRLVTSFHHGVVFVPLAGVRDASVVTAAVRDAASPAEGDGRRLLVLDNFEHVLDAAIVVADVLAAHASLSVLVTSRTPLRIAGEREVSVTSLGLPPMRAVSADEAGRAPAVALFVDRARAAVPGFAVTAENAAAVVEICRRLDGLPLALELAAARVRLLPPRALLARLEKRLPLLTGGARDQPERHKTLRDAIGWSDHLLAPADRRAFAALAVFVGGFTLEAAEAVGGDPAGMLESMEALASSSLLRRVELPDGTARFQMLETVREYAAERLVALGEADAARERHARFHVDLAARAAAGFGTAEARWLDVLDLEHDNLRAAFDWAIAAGDAAIALSLVESLWRFWEARGYVREGLERTTAALGVPAGPALRRAHMRGLYVAGVLAEATGDYGLARDRFRETLEAARLMGDTWSVASALNNLAIIALREGALDTARSLYEESLARWRQIGNRSAVGLSLTNLGNVLRRLCEPERARRLYEESLALFESLEDRRGVALASTGLGDVSRDIGDTGGARAAYTRALKLHRAMDAQRDAAGCLLDLAGLLRDDGQADQARRAFEDALATFAELGDARGIARALEQAARTACAAGNRRRAMRLAGASGALRTAMGMPLAPDEERQLQQDLHGGDAARASAETAAWLEEGAAMDVEHAIEYALAES